MHRLSRQRILQRPLCRMLRMRTDDEIITKEDGYGYSFFAGFGSDCDGFVYEIPVSSAETGKKVPKLSGI